MIKPAPQASAAEHVDVMPDPAHVGAAPASLRAIALFEAAKGLLALLVAMGLVWVGPAALRTTVESLRARLGLDSHGGIQGLVDAIGPDAVHLAVTLALLYSLLRALEAWGLWRSRGWASWLGCIGAALYLPFELYSLTTQPGALTALVFVVNVAVVAVLGRDVLRRHR
jgi:uncharacterized membrane protein (DUF2068 family)